MNRKFDTWVEQFEHITVNNTVGLQYNSIIGIHNFTLYVGTYQMPHALHPAFGLTDTSISG